MRVVIINPNTSEAMTLKMVDAARALLPQGTVIVPATGRFGPRYIASRAAYAVGCHAALDAYATHGAGADAILLACYGDPGLDALREVADVPVISLIDASSAVAAANGRRFAIITGGERWGPMLTEMIAARGLAGQLAAIRTVAPTGGQIAADPEGAHALLADTCQRAIAEDGAQAIVLGGAGLVGIAAAIQHHVAVPVICSVEAGLLATKAALAEQPSRQKLVHLEPVESIGLSEPLARLLAPSR
jgi:allantoin racemase